MQAVKLMKDSIPRLIHSFGGSVDKMLSSSNFYLTFQLPTSVLSL